MSFAYSTRSKNNLNTSHPFLQLVFGIAILRFDNTVIIGHRYKKEQNRAFVNGKSKLRYPQSKHNATPSLAVDAAPYPIDEHDRERATLFAGYVLGIAERLGITIRWGGDWNMNFKTGDNSFDDLWHFELVL